MADGELLCREKLRFATKREATAAKVVAQHQHGHQLTVYLCRHCSWWHLASR
jgi:hypothetical protein